VYLRGHQVRPCEGVACDLPDETARNDPWDARLIAGVPGTTGSGHWAFYADVQPGQEEFVQIDVWMEARPRGVQTWNPLRDTSPGWVKLSTLRAQGR